MADFNELLDLVLEASITDVNSITSKMREIKTSFNKHKNERDVSAMREDLSRFENALNTLDETVNALRADMHPDTLRQVAKAVSVAAAVSTALKEILLRVTAVLGSIAFSKYEDKIGDDGNIHFNPAEMSAGDKAIVGGFNAASAVYDKLPPGRILGIGVSGAAGKASSKVGHHIDDKNLRDFDTTHRQLKATMKSAKRGVKDMQKTIRVVERLNAKHKK